MSLLALFLAVALGPTAPSVSDEHPFPTQKTVDLKEPGRVYTVEGRQYVPKNVKITVLRHCIIRGVGDGATLVIDGPLKMKAVTGGRVRFENVWLEIGPKCKDVDLASVEFWGGGGLRTPDDFASRAKIFIIAGYWYRGTRFEIAAMDGKVELQNCHFDEPVKITGAPRSAKSGSNAVVQLEGCSGVENGQPRGMLGGLQARAVKDLLVRNCDLSGAQTSLTDCLKVEFNGNNARSERTVFTQTKYGGFKRTRIGNCDFRTQLVFEVPADGTKAERVMLDHSWFGGMTSEKDILRSMIHDQRKDSSVGVMCSFSKICPVPLKLAGNFE